MDRGACWATVHRVTKNWTGLQWLSTHARSIIYTFYIWGYGSTERLINFSKVSQLTSDRALFSSIMNRCYSQATPSSSPSYNFLHNLLCFMEGEQCFSTHIVNRVFFTQALRALPGTTWLLCHPPAAGRSLAAARVSENSLPPPSSESSPHPFMSSPFLWPALKISRTSLFGFVSC